MYLVPVEVVVTGDVAEHGVREHVVAEQVVVSQVAVQAVLAAVHLLLELQVNLREDDAKFYYHRLGLSPV